VQFELRHVAVGRRPARYIVAGAGEPLVLVHGLAGSLRWWSALVEPLAAHRRVYAVDLPRAARSAPPAQFGAWLGDWLDAMGLQCVDLVGHSLGGAVAADLAATRHERVRRLVLVAPAGIPCGRGLHGRALSLLEALYAIRDSMSMVAGDALRTGPLGLVRTIAFVSGRDVRAELSAVRMPTLLVWGERDRLVPAWLAEEWHRALPRSRVVLVPGGHVPMLEAPRELATSIISFLAEQLQDDVGDEAGTRVVDGVRLAGDHHEPPAR
jgi:pimeloyl-ACP methyl ester carboxylesterase